MTEIDVSALLKNEGKHNTHLNNLILNINIRNPKIFSHLFRLMLFVVISVMILIMVILIILILQYQELQTQIHSVMRQAKNNQCNCVEMLNRVQRSVDYNDSISPIAPSTFELFNQEEIRDNRHNDTDMSMPSNKIVSNRTYHEDNAIKKHASGLSDIARSPSKLMVNLFSSFNKGQNFEMQNYMAMENKVSNHKLITWSEPYTRRLRRMKRNNGERQSGKNKEVRRQNEERNEKRKRERKEKRRQSERKGEKRRQNRRKRNRRESRPLLATFIGAVPELNNAECIGPWVKSKTENHQYDFTKFHLVENDMSIEVGLNGLYIISVQIFYFGDMNFSYNISLNSEGSSTKRTLVTCAATSFNKDQVTCYTSVMIYLQRGDRLSVQQREKNRLIDLRGGFSQIQIMLLANDRRYRSR